MRDKCKLEINASLLAKDRMKKGITKELLEFEKHLKSVKRESLNS
jgi:hypothetical protein